LNPMGPPKKTSKGEKKTIHNEKQPGGVFCGNWDNLAFKCEFTKLGKGHDAQGGVTPYGYH